MRGVIVVAVALTLTGCRTVSVRETTACQSSGYHEVRRDTSESEETKARYLAAVNHTARASVVLVVRTGAKIACREILKACLSRHARGTRDDEAAAALIDIIVEYIFDDEEDESLPPEMPRHYGK